MSVTVPATVRRVLDGPPADRGPERFADHLARIGARPRIAPASAARFIEELDRSGLRGRGGAGFPAARKWAAVAARSRGGAVAVANGSEGEPASAKDRVLMTLRPHLVIDGLLVAAEAVGAREAVLYIPRTFADAREALSAALAERRAAGERDLTVRLVSGPHRYVAGEESAVVSYLNGGDARPTFTPPRPYERGIGGHPTLVQNVETLAHAALVARRGSAWFRSAGVPSAPGSVLVTVSGAIERPGVYEVALGTTIGEVVALAGGAPSGVHAVLCGGYAGRWLAAAAAWPAAIGVDVPVGAGVLAVLPPGGCGVAETARALDFLARESARQCGPCVHGVGALATTFGAVATGAAKPGDVRTLLRWSDDIARRGACHHPDGAVSLLRSALETFDAEVRGHIARRRCTGCTRPAVLPTPHLTDGWR